MAKAVYTIIDIKILEKNESNYKKIKVTTEVTCNALFFIPTFIYFNYIFYILCTFSTTIDFFKSCPKFKDLI